MSVIGWEDKRQEREPGSGSAEDRDCVFMLMDVGASSILVKDE